MLPAQAALLTSPEAEVPAAAVGRVGRAVLSGLAYYITSATRVLCKRNDATRRQQRRRQRRRQQLQQQLRQRHMAKKKGARLRATSFAAGAGDVISGTATTSVALSCCCCCRCRFNSQNLASLLLLWLSFSVSVSIFSLMCVVVVSENFSKSLTAAASAEESKLEEV